MNREKELIDNEKEIFQEKEENTFEGNGKAISLQEDFSHYSKEQLYKLLENYKIEDNYSEANVFLKQVKNAFESIVDVERDEALQKFLQGGGEEEDFDYKKDEVSIKFEKVYDQLKDKISKFYSNLDKEKERNLEAKTGLLEKLRNLISSEETTTSITALKDIQDEWKKIGPVPANESNNLWANYNALIERFYDNRSIYFELKELDRKKNLESKIELVEKAEQLANIENINEAIKELKQLHEEYKHIGPVPKEEQEKLWNRFKAASDKVYERRKEYFDKLKGELDVNYDKKLALATKMEEASDFSSEKINDWKNKTTEILSVQEEWKQIGRVPSDKAKEISKRFWGACKAFFHKKDQFFKQLEQQKEENLKKKIELCEQAEALKENEDFNTTANQLKDLQKQWENIGPVPNKNKEEVFKRFKQACDFFFNKRREHLAETEKEYVENLQRKNLLIEKLENLSNAPGVKDLETVKQIQEEWKEIGFVPKSELKNVSSKFNSAIESYLSKVEKGVENVENLKLAIEVSALKGASDGGRKIHRKEQEIAKKISSLRSEIDRYNTNIEFLAHSKSADKLKAQVQAKIDEVSKELQTLQEQLKIIKESKV